MSDMANVNQALVAGVVVVSYLVSLAWQASRIRQKRRNGEPFSAGLVQESLAAFAISIGMSAAALLVCYSVMRILGL